MMLILMLSRDNMAIFHINHTTTLRSMRSHNGMIAIKRKESDWTRAGARHNRRHRVSRIEHSHSIRRNILHNHTFDHGQIFYRCDKT